MLGQSFATGTSPRLRTRRAQNDSVIEGNERRDLAGPAIRAAGTRYATYGIGLIGSVVLARGLGAGGRGGYAYVTTLAATAVAVGHASIEQALMFEWSRTGHRTLAATTATLSVALGVVVAGATVALVFSGVAELPAGVEKWMVLLAAGAVPLMMLAQHTSGLLLNAGRVSTINKSEFVMSAVRVAAFSAAATLAALDVSAGLAIWVATLLIAPALRLMDAVAAFGIGRPHRALAWSLMWRGSKYHIGALSLALILRVDVLLLANRVEVDEVGRYALAVTLVELALRAGEASSQVAVQVQIASDSTESARVTARVARLNVLVAAFLLVGLVVAGPLAIGFVFGSSFEGTEAAVFALAPGILALALERPLGTYIVRLDRPVVVSIGLSMGLAANVLLNLVLIPEWGIVGAAVASTLVYIGLASWIGAWFLRASGLGIGALTPYPRDVVSALDSIRAFRRKGL